MAFTSLLVPLDYGPHSDRAMRIAARLAAGSGLPVELVTVTDPRLDPEDDRAELAVRAEQLAPVVCRITVVRDDDVRGALTRILDDRPDALPVIGTAAPGPLGELFDPGAWEAALDATGRPALVVGPHVDEEGLDTGRLVMAVTESTQPQRLADAVCRWADSFDSVVDVVDVVGEGGLAAGRAQSSVREASRALRAHDRPAAIRVVRADDLADAVREVARRATSVIAIGTRHWTTSDRVHRSSLARSVVRSAKVPILLVPARDE